MNSEKFLVNSIYYSILNSNIINSYKIKKRAC